MRIQPLTITGDVVSRRYCEATWRAIGPSLEPAAAVRGSAPRTASIV